MRKFTYRKIKGGNHSRRENGKLVTYTDGELMRAFPSEIKPFQDQWELADKADLTKVEKDDNPPPDEGLVVVNRGSGWYDVVNSVNNKPINAKKLRKDEAMALVAEMVEEEEENDDDPPEVGYEMGNDTPDDSPPDEDDDEPEFEDPPEFEESEEHI